MTFTYDISDSTDKIAYIRLRIQDTVEDEARFSDEEIARVLEDEGNDEDLAIDVLLTITKVMISNEPSALQIGASAIQQDISGRLRALDAGQRRHASLESTVPNFESDVSTIGRSDV